ncbi:glycerol-3-phosphate transporter [Vibrio azureus]|uniref:Glycerol-3-phosphate transporter n=1 Tax=Vibrio azureus NBRC 104587 TaxID=1219077 RepID=U3C7J4_9VIBR|nr:glycerol-3-phosphate transporter [Vibrio azureus]AUI86812.1 glycerol-3-phosphate transporter [Vibrio azureus]GAD74413.1 glycerol-3-phosphate transporter [Vibrio azureus NBRC 104587]
MFGIFKPKAHIERLRESKIDRTYTRLRWQLFAGIFFGYAGYYLVRKNFSLAMPYLIEQGFSRGDLGVALAAVSIAYGLSKFLMGSVSDRSNPRYFLSAGLIMSALVMFCFGFMPWATASIPAMFCLLFLNGWFQGMGWPACGRTMVHWWSRKERGKIVSVWNVAHNVGGGLIGPMFLFGLWAFNDDWHTAFYVPAFFATLVAVFIWITLRDTPQSCGLPSIEEYKNDYPDSYDKAYENEMTAKEIFFKYVFSNKLLWAIAIANAFVYLIRYGVLDWAPVYLSEAKGFSVDKSSWAYFLYEWAGIPGTLLCGWISDKLFKGRRAPAGILFMALVMIAVLVYWFNPAGNPEVDMMALVAIGFLIYGPVMLIGLYALELAPKKAAGTAAGLTGLFGYLGGAVAANAILGYTVDHFGWDGGFIILVGSCVAALLCLVYAYFGERDFHNKKQQEKTALAS